jgi:hypothetical protein
MNKRIFFAAIVAQITNQVNPEFFVCFVVNLSFPD